MYMNDEKIPEPIKVQCGYKTFFFDIKQAKNNHDYLVITQSLFDKKTNTRKRNSFLLFKEDLVKFKETLNLIQLKERA